jgi:tRNA C32,U32 (ribose-2'-O)-methylase TrmJ
LQLLLLRLRFRLRLMLHPQKKAVQPHTLAAVAAEVGTQVVEEAEVDMPPEEAVDGPLEVVAMSAAARTLARDPRFPIQLLLGRAPAAMLRALQRVVLAIDLQ